MSTATTTSELEAVAAAVPAVPVVAAPESSSSTTTTNASSSLMIITDTTEVALGISTYMSPHVIGFSAISKARFSDFMVHEVGLDGRIAHLTCMEPQVVPVVMDNSSSSSATNPSTASGGLDENEVSKASTTRNDLTNDDDNNDEKQEKMNVAITTMNGDGDDETARKRKRANEAEPEGSSSTTKKHKELNDDSTGTTTAASTAIADDSKTMTIDEKLPDWSTIQQELEAILLTSSTTIQAAAALSHDVVSFLQNTTNTLATATTADLKAMIKDEDHIKFVSIVVSLSSSSSNAAAAENSTSSSNSSSTKDKDFRRRLHEWIRSRLDFCARGDTADIEDDTSPGNDSTKNAKNNKEKIKVIRIWHKAFERQMPTWKTFEKYSRDNNNNNTRSSHNRKLDNIHKMPYLKFVLYKENMDTGAALFQLQKRFADVSGGGRGGGGRGGRGGRGGGRNNNNKFQQHSQQLHIGHAGMKDKRGVTAQFITVPTRQTNMHALTRMCNNYNNNNRNNNYYGHSTGQALLRVGNFEFVPEELRLGRLQGNHFDIVLRNVQVPNIDSTRTTCTNAFCQEMLQNAVNALKRHGFINYFGLQRFGKHHDTHLTGIAIVKGDYATAIDIILRPKPGMEEQESVTRARIQWQERFHNLLGKTTTTTSSSSDNNNNKNNDKDDNKAARITAEQECAKSIVNCFNRSFQSSEVTVLHSLIQHPCDYERAFMSLNKTMRMMFLHALQSFLWNHVASLRIQQGYSMNHGKSKNNSYNGSDDNVDDNEQCCHEVLVGDLVLLDPKTATTETSEEILPSSSSASSNHNRKDSSCRIPAVHVVTPEDVAAKRFKLHDVVIPLMGSKTVEPRIDSITTLFSKLLDEMGLTREALTKAGNSRDLHCTGDYRKLLCMPADVDFQLLEYNDALQPLVPTDMMRLQGIQIKIPNTATAAAAAGEAVNDSKSSCSLLAMRVGFTLPSSAYATMALRELMKRPTSAAYQGKLELGNNSNSRNNGNQLEEVNGE